MVKRYAHLAPGHLSAHAERISLGSGVTATGSSSRTTAASMPGSRLGTTHPRKAALPITSGMKQSAAVSSILRHAMASATFIRARPDLSIDADQGMTGAARIPARKRMTRRETTRAGYRKRAGISPGMRSTSAARCRSAGAISTRYGMADVSSDRSRSGSLAS